ncbi:hypothetical protein DC522_20755 [Microvirga sp. KLBC 81]|nr:hypothetical protein DC522_20755 [Microvirga sp. KLBC 81]
MADLRPAFETNALSENCEFDTDAFAVFYCWPLHSLWRSAGEIDHHRFIYFQTLEVCSNQCVSCSGLSAAVGPRDERSMETDLPFCLNLPRQTGERDKSTD